MLRSGLSAAVLAAVLLCNVIELHAEGSLEGDRAALEALHRAAGEDDWKNDTNWLSPEPLSGWFGVDVGEDGRVEELHLWDSGL